jgi:PKD repeat protein
VTDNSGATNAVTHQVTVAPPPNQAPVAAFTSSCNGLTCTFDGSGASDADGVVAAHAWDFGDGQTATGPTATHTYATAGTKTVTLTVTDDDGATGAVSHDVVVTAVRVLASDAFGRTVASGPRHRRHRRRLVDDRVAGRVGVGGRRVRAVSRWPPASRAKARLTAVSSQDTDVHVHGLDRGAADRRRRLPRHHRPRHGRRRLPRPGPDPVHGRPMTAS